MSTLTKVALSFIGQLKPDRVKARAIAENVYLYCASAGLATVVRGWFDRAALSTALRLSEHEHVVVAQTVGYPRGYQ